jgi:hypothetical protein
MYWNGFTDIVTILLTAAIAYTGWRQVKTAEKQDETAKNLLKLQQIIEEQRNQAWIFLRIVSFVQTALQFAALEISNLSEVGIWIEKITVHLEVPSGMPNKAHALPVEKPLASMGTMPISNLSQEIFLLVAAPGAERQPVTFWAEVEYWAKGTWRSELTIHYSADVNQWSIQNPRPASST